MWAPAQRAYGILIGMHRWFAALGVSLALVSVFAVASFSAPAPYQYPGTKRMADRLAAIFRAQDWHTDPYYNRQRIASIRQWLDANADSPNVWSARLRLASELLEAGDSAQAAKELEQARSLAKLKGLYSNGPAGNRFAADLGNLLAISYLRQGEQENCLMNHGAESCIFPIRPSAIHMAMAGARGAVREYSALLDMNPTDLDARWLLNIASMALGEQDRLPAKWQISSKIFDSDYDAGRFHDVAPALGLNITGHAGGVIAEDFDGDGLIDLMVSSSHPMDQLRFFHNNGDGTFTDRTEAAGLTGEVGGLNLVHADYNNDGHPDVLVLRGGWLRSHGEYPMSLLRNNGNGTFDDVTEEAGLLSAHPTQTAAWSDYDNDGRLDLFVGREECAGESHPSSLYHNNGDGTFTDIAPSIGLDHLGLVKGVAWGDYNNDGWPDLYISRNGQPNILLRNDGKPRSSSSPAWSFTDVTREAGVAEPKYSFATWFWDYDNDGWPDLFVAPYKLPEPGEIAAFHMGLPNHAETPRLYHNNRDGTFTDVTKQTQLDRAMLVMGANFGDIDNDGWLDCYLGTGAPDYRALLPNRMFRNNQGKSFQDVTTSTGSGHLQKGHAVAFADFNNDGNLDIFESIGGFYEGDSYESVLFENPGHHNHWIDLDLEGVRSNRSAIGARIRIRIDTAEGPREIFRTVSSGGSFGDSPFRVHAGLAQASALREVEIRWPTSKTAQVFRNLRMDRGYRIRENSAQPEPLNRKPFAFRSSQAP
jgi:tetratricopeptide (TPR) repeat protein